MTRSLVVQVQRDHLESLAIARRPIEAVAELIWNGLDADAARVAVRLRANAFHALDQIEVEDDGHGLTYQHAIESFARLGGSTKRNAGRTPLGRRFHGSHGRGRFRAFALGGIVEWDTVFLANKQTLMRFRIEGRRDSVDTFLVDEPAPSDRQTGTRVRIDNLTRNFHSLRNTAEAAADLAEEFALYLRQYPDVQISYDGTLVDPRAAEELVAEKDLGFFDLSVGKRRAALTIIEWKAAPSRRALFLCDSAGFALYDVPPGIQAPGYSFTAYLKSDALRELANELPVEELHADVKRLLEAARDEMRAHFKRREAERRTSRVAQWKRDHVYPFEGEPKNVIDETERQVFDIIALAVTEEVPDFEAGAAKVRRLAFHLLREALTSGPTALKRILQQVVELPKERQEEFARLLDRASLDAIIGAAKLVADRLEFLAGFESLVFDEPSRSRLKERTQLQRIVADHTWIFGEEYHLTVDDESLSKALEAHVGKREAKARNARNNRRKTAPVLREDGRRGILDLMLSRRVPQADPRDRVHLIVELKPPKIAIDDKALEQTDSYAQAIAADERFKETPARWEVWALANKVSAAVARKGRSPDRPRHCIYVYDDPPMRIWVKTWGEVIADARARLQFFQDQLRYAATAESGLAFLKQTHEKWLPTGVPAVQDPTLGLAPDSQKQGISGTRSDTTV